MAGRTARAEVELPFPLKGYDGNWAYADQPEGTSPSMCNVRAYSTDEGRARGGSRPGVRLAYDQQTGGGGAVQWIGWLDYGFGDAVVYRDAFEYADGALATRNGTKWPYADSRLLVRDGYVRLEDPASDCSSGNCADVGSDTWEDFTLQARIEWTYGTTAAVVLGAGDGGGPGSGGASVTVSYVSTEVSWPGLGYTGSLTIHCVSGPNEARWSRAWGPFFSTAGGVVRVDADRDRVRVFWDGAQVLDLPRDDGTCGAVGFSLSKQNDTTRLPDAAIDVRLHEFVLLAASRPAPTARELVVLAGRNLWHESVAGGLSAVTADDPFAPVPLLSAAPCGGNLFVVDGQGPKVYRAASGVVTDWAATRGELVRTATLAVNWRNRLVLAGTADDPQNYFMSRQGDPWDFDYGQDDAASAVAGGLSDAGRVGDPIRALCPVNDDVLILGCTRSLWRLHGDPRQGGWAEKVADDVGIVGQNAWTLDPAGVLYFLSEEGLCRMTALGRPENLSRRRVPQLAGLRAVQPGAAAAAGERFVTVCCDARRHGILLLLSPQAEEPGGHWFYDLRLDAFFPESYPPSAGPTCAAFYNAAEADRRRLLLGGRYGRIYCHDEAAKCDVAVVEGQCREAAIDAYVWTRPRRLLGRALGEAVLVGLTGTLSAGSDGVAYSVHAGDAEEAVLAAPAAAGGTWAAGRNPPDRTRVRGAVHAVRLSGAGAASAWAVERIVAEAVPGGSAR